MIVHVFTSMSSLFRETYISFLKRCFHSHDHTYFVWNTWGGISYLCNGAYKKCSIAELENAMNDASKILLHSIVNPALVIFFAFQSQLLGKCYWVIWGGDLHFHVIAHTKVKWRFLELIRQRLIRRLAGVCTLLDGDYDLLKEWYTTSAKHFDVLYPADKDIYDKLSTMAGEGESHSHTRKILLGNSATPSNRHKEVIDILYARHCVFDELICPLSYGDRQYGEMVEQYGTERFGDKFIPLKHKLQLKDYISLLNTVDVGIFNNNRQQALGNIAYLTLLNKKIYLDDGYDIFKHLVFKEHYHYYPISSIDNKIFDFNEEEIKANREKMLLRLSECNVAGVWSKVFQD